MTEKGSKYNHKLTGLATIFRQVSGYQPICRALSY